jgi:hypothetical protein
MKQVTTIGLDIATTRLKPPDQENPYRPSTSSARFWSGPDTRMALWPAALCAAQTDRTHGRINPRCVGTQNPCQWRAVHTGSI